MRPGSYCRHLVCVCVFFSIMIQTHNTNGQNLLAKVMSGFVVRNWGFVLCIELIVFPAFITKEEINICNTTVSLTECSFEFNGMIFY